MRAINLTSKKEIASNVAVADGLLKRLKGLLGSAGMHKGEALLIKPCKGIHTFGMHFPIDVIFLNNDKNVIAVKKNMLPNRMTPIYLRAMCVLEMPSGTIETTTTNVGDLIEIA